MSVSNAPAAPGTLAQPLNGALLYIGVVALLIAGLQPVILGSSARLLAASLLVGDADAAGAMRLGAGCLMVAMNLIVLISLRLRAQGGPADIPT